MFSHIIIPAAGKGTRFGGNMPKALINICGKPIIQWQLEAIPKNHDICVSVVVGFRGEEVESLIKSLKLANVRVLYNNNYDTTSVVDSIKVAERYFGEKVIILDGDVLISKHHIKPFLTNELIAIREINQWTDPVFVKLDEENHVVEFNRSGGSHEWACVCSTYSHIFQKGDNFIFNSLQRLLPCKSFLIDSPEIDTQNDLRNAEIWIKTNGRN